MRLLLYVIGLIFWGYTAVFYASRVLGAVCAVWFLMAPVSFLWGLYAVKRLRVLLSFQENPVSVGEKALLQIRLENPTPFSMGQVQVDLEWNHSYEQVPVREKLRIAVGGKQKSETVLITDCALVGNLHCRVLRLRAQDSLKLFTYRKKIQAEKVLTILPPSYPADIREKEQSRGSRGEGEALQTERGGENSSEVYQIREYHAGDRTRSIHWKLSARTETLQVREFSHQANVYYALLPDLSASDGELTGINEVFCILLSLGQALLREREGFFLAWYKPEQQEMERRWISLEEEIYETFWEIFEAGIGQLKESVSVRYRQFYPEEILRIAVDRKLNLTVNEEVQYVFQPGKIQEGLEEILS